MDNILAAGEVTLGTILSNQKQNITSLLRQHHTSAVHNGLICNVHYSGPGYLRELANI